MNRWRLPVITPRQRSKGVFQLRLIRLGQVAGRIGLIANQAGRQDKQSLTAVFSALCGRKQQLAQPGDIPQYGNFIQIVGFFCHVKTTDDQRLLLVDHRLGADVTFAHIRSGLLLGVIGKSAVLDVDDQVNLIGAIGFDHPGYNLKAGARGDWHDIGHSLTDGLDILCAVEVDNRWLVFQGHDRGVGHHRCQAARFKCLDICGEAINLKHRHG